MRILITGAQGFIGKSLKSLFEKSKNFNILCPNSKELNLLNGEKVLKYLSSHDIDWVIHSANHHWHPRDSKSKSKVDQLSSNLIMYSNLINNRKYYGELIYFGSGAELPRNLWNESISETDIGSIIPSDSYGMSKFLMNENCRQRDDLFNLRLFGVCGEFDDWRFRFISNMCVLAVNNKDLTINQNSYFDYLYTYDLYKIIIRFIENKPSYGDYNVCTSNTLKLTELAEIVKTISKKKLNIKVTNPGIGIRYGGVNNKLLNKIGKFNFTPMNQVIENILKYLTEKKDDNNVNEIVIK